jgi:hypothetical protein
MAGDGNAAVQQAVDRFPAQLARGSGGGASAAGEPAGRTPPGLYTERLLPLFTDGSVVMLVTFSCRAYADITMFGDIAVHLLKLMGHSGTVPGALLAQDVPRALELLEAGVAAAAQSPAPEEDEDGEPAVPLAHRALPLVELLRAATKAKVNVMWDRSG